MSKLSFSSAEAYLEAVEPSKQAAVKALFECIQQHIPQTFETGIQYNMIAWFVPFSIYPQGYHCKPEIPLPFANLAAQKNHIAIYHMGLYGDTALMDWFIAEHAKRSPKKLDIGKSCIRYKTLDDIPLDLIAELFEKITPEQWVNTYTKLHLKSKA